MYICCERRKGSKLVVPVSRFRPFGSSSDSLFAAGAPLSLGMLTKCARKKTAAPIGDRVVY